MANDEIVGELAERQARQQEHLDVLGTDLNRLSKRQKASSGNSWSAEKAVLVTAILILLAPVATSCIWQCFKAFMPLFQ